MDQQLNSDQPRSIEDAIGPDAVKLEKAYLCSKCHSTNPAAAQDHATTEDCLKSWQTLAAQSLAAVEVAKRKIKAHQKMRHLGFRVTNVELDFCTRCLLTGFSAYQHLAGYFDTMPKNDSKGGLVDVRSGVSPLPRAAMPPKGRAPKVPLFRPLGAPPAPAPEGDRGSVAAGDLLRDLPPIEPMG